MKKTSLKFAGIAVLAAFFVLTARPACAAAAKESAEAYIVKTEGIAVKSDDKTDFKKRAITDAYRNAVADAAVNLLKEDDAKRGADFQGTLEARILPNSSNYVLTYKVLSEGWMTHMDIAPPVTAVTAAPQGAASSIGVEAYHVRIEAGIDAVRLRGDLARLNAATGLNTAQQQISITFTDFSDYNALLAFMDALKKVPQIKEVTYDSLLRGRVRLLASITGDPQAVINRITKELADEYAAAPTGKLSMQIKPAAKRGI